VSGILKGVARALGTDAGIEICRGYILERLSLVTPKDLYNAIKDGAHTMGVAESKDRNFGKKWGRIIERFSYKGDKIRREYLTAENVLEWLRTDRPDLASLIINMNPQGMEWLREDVKQVYDFLFSEPKPQRTVALTLVKREQPKKEEEPSKVELEQGAEDAGIHASQEGSQQKTTETQSEPTETAEKA